MTDKLNQGPNIAAPLPNMGEGLHGESTEGEPQARPGAFEESKLARPAQVGYGARPTPPVPEPSPESPLERGLPDVVTHEQIRQASLKRMP